MTFSINPLQFVDATFSIVGSGSTRPTPFSVATSGFFGPNFAAGAPLFNGLSQAWLDGNAISPDADERYFNRVKVCRE